MKAHEFLERWRADYINSGTQQSDVDALVETLVSDASGEGFDRNALETAAGRPLEDYMTAAIRTAISEELW